MTTGQNYVGKASYATTLEPTASKGAQTAKIKAPPSSTAQKQLAPPIATKDFLREYPDLIGLPADQLDDSLREILPTQPVSFHELTDGTNLLKGLLGQPLPLVDAHLALMIRGEVIVDLVCVNTNEELPIVGNAHYLKADDLDSRYLLGRALEAGATRLLLVSILKSRHNWLEEEERAFISTFGQTLALVGVELIDWLLLTDEQTSSWLTDQGNAGENPPIDESADNLDEVTANSSELVSQPRPAIESTINLTLGVRNFQGRLSEVELIYWSLEASKETYKKTLLNQDSGEDEIEEADWHFCKLQELQNITGYSQLYKDYPQNH